MRPSLALAVAILAAAPALHAQTGARPFLDWRTLETPHFVFHYPAEDADWARFAAARLEAAQPAVTRLVGFTPRGRVTVLVENPSNEANGSTYPWVDAPAIVLWPTPPGPRGGIGHTRGFTEELVTHEYAHAAHLARPSRNAGERRLAELLPVELGPLLFRTPRWVTEGYATYVEGRLTGSGRPHGVERAALMRQLALDGRMPTYDAISATGGFRGGEYAYLVGSAYLEWLTARGGGDSSLVHLWRRLSARQSRSFDAGFAGVFGESPAALYDRFRAELTVDAFALERARGGSALPAAVGGPAAAADSARLVATRGALVQRFAGYVGDPAASRDGKLLAMTVAGPGSPSTVLVLSTTRDTLTTAQRKARERARARDPEDVPAVERYPRPLRVVSRLPAINGFAFGAPRFFPDGRQVLVTRSVPRADGTTRAQLFVWDRTTGRVRQLTRGAGVSGGDLSPDGRTIAAVRCDAGRCGLVLVDAERGTVRTLAAGTFDSPYYRPRFSPDGRTVAASVQGNGHWRPVLVDVASGAVREVGPADAFSRYEPTFTADGRAVIVTSEEAGIADLERIDLASGATTRLTAVTGAASASEPAHDGRSVYFLSMHSGGYDLRSTSIDSAVTLTPIAPSAYALAARIPDTAVAPLIPVPVGSERAYGLGPRSWSVVPGGAFGAGNETALLALANTDPIGRLSATLQGAVGDRASWRGGSAAARFRGLRPAIEGTAFYLEQRPSQERDARGPISALDVDYLGGLATAELTGDWRSRALEARVGGSGGSVRTVGATRETRAFGLAELAGDATFSRGRQGVGLNLRAALSSGSTGGDGWTRVVAGAAIGTTGFGTFPLQFEGAIGAIDRGAPAFEQFAVGGLASPITSASLLPQRISMPVLPTGLLVGDRYTTYRVSTPLAGARAYLWGGSAGDRQITDWHQVAGLELSGSADDLWLVHVPRVRATFGAGVPLDRALGRRVRGYGSLTWQP